MGIDYELILYSLQSPRHTANPRRVYLVIDKWCRDAHSQGIYIRDLPQVIQILDFLRTKILESSEFMSLLGSCLNACSRPILQSKAYEHLRHAELIASYLKQISAFWSIDSTLAKCLVAQCLSSIVNGYEDVSSGDDAENKANMDVRPLRDKAFLQMLIREEGILETVVNEFFLSTQNYEAEIRSHETILPNIQVPSEDTQESEEDSSSASYSGENVKALENACDLMLFLCLALSKDIENTIVLNQYSICNCILSLINIIIRFNNKKVRHLIDLLWNCLEVHYKHTLPALNNYDDDVSTMKSIVDVESATHILIDIFIQLANRGYRKVDKQLRNNILLMLAILAKFPKAKGTMVKTGILPILITFSGVGDVGIGAWDGFYPHVVPRNFVSASEIDLEFKRLLWLLIGDLLRSHDESAYRIVGSSPFMSVLILYAEQDSHEIEPAKMMTTSHPLTHSEQDLEKSSYSHEERTAVSTVTMTTLKSTPTALFDCLSRTVLRELQVVGSCILSEHAVHMLDAFHSLRGSLRVAALLAKYIGSPHVEHRNLIYYVLLTLISTASYSESIRRSISTTETLQKLISQFQSSEDDSIRALSARLISILCYGQPYSQGLFKDLGGIEILNLSIVKYADVRNPQIGRNSRVLVSNGDSARSPVMAAATGDENTLVVAILGCLRATVLNNGENERYFAQVRGIDSLLDMLEVSPFVFQLQLMRFIADLSKNTVLTLFFKSWRSGKTMRYAVKLLVDCWLDEEVRLSVHRKEGVLENIMYPLGPQLLSTVDRLGVDLRDDSSTSKSFRTDRISLAVISSRKVDSLPGRIPYNIREDLYQNDLRCLIACAIRHLYIKDPKISVSSEGAIVLNRNLSLESEDSVNSPAAGGILKDDFRNSDYPYGLLPSDFQVLALCWGHQSLRMGHCWYSIHEELASERLELSESDSNRIENAREEYFKTSRIIQMEQTRWKDIYTNLLHTQSESFTSKIISQKNAQIKAEWIKKNARLVRTVPKRPKANLSIDGGAEGKTI